MSECLLGCNVSVLVRMLAGVAHACLLVAHPWEEGVWQMQCNRTLASPTPLSELAVWWR